MENTAKKKGHPLGFYTNCITYVLERFAYYGSKPLILLYCITAVAQGGLGIEATEATLIAANITTFGALTPIVGSYITDNWLGARFAIPLGAIIKAIAWLIAAKATTGMHMQACVILHSIGNGLMNVNLSGLQGRLYEDKSQLDSAYSIQYSFVNVGAFFGSLLTGYLYLNTFKHGEVLGFRQCFYLGAGFALASAVWFVLNWRNLRGQGLRPYKYITDENGNVIGTAAKDDKKAEKAAAKEPLTRQEKRHVIAICIVALLSVLFFLFYYQQDLALTIYMNSYVDMHLGSLEVPPSWITTTLNSVFCVILGPVMASLWTKLSKRPQGDINMFCKVGLGFLFLGLGYGLLMVAEIFRGVGAPDTEKVSVIWMAFFSILLTTGEIVFSPLKDSFASKYAPKKVYATMIAVVTLATFFASLLTPYVQVMVEMFSIFQVFVAITALLIISALVVFAINKKLNKLVEE